MKNATPLNLPNNKDQFETVPFVHKMTAFQLKVFIKRIWENLQLFANQMEGRRRDIPYVMDCIRDGNRWTAKDLDDRYVYGAYQGYILRFDTLDKKFDILDKNYEQVEDSIQGITRSDLKKFKEQEKEQA